MLEDYEGSQAELMKMLAEQNATPAYILRAQTVEGMWRDLLSECAVHRHELLEMPRLRIGQLSALINGHWQQLSAFVDAKFAAKLQALHQSWDPQLRMELSPTTSPRKIRNALGDLVTSFERFNIRWTKHVHELSLTEINYQRQQYNDYYLVEKAAALGSDKLAEHGFSRLNPATADDILAVHPLLVLPNKC